MTLQLLPTPSMRGRAAAETEGQIYMAAAGCNKGCQVKQLPNQRAKDRWQLLAVIKGTG